MFWYSRSSVGIYVSQEGEPGQRSEAVRHHRGRASAISALADPRPPAWCYRHAGGRHAMKGSIRQRSAGIWTLLATMELDGDAP